MAAFGHDCSVVASPGLLEFFKLTAQNGLARGFGGEKRTMLQQRASMARCDFEIRSPSMSVQLRSNSLLHLLLSSIHQFVGSV
jgi:hypothetical protein